METNKQNEIRNAYEHSAQVQCIPASIKKTTEHSEEDPLVVAPYCRVSTDNKDQLASYELQCQYYKEYVSKHPGWRLYDIYADEGISGTSVKKRTDFLRMIDDCKAGKIDMIIVKNIARFARNVVDCVATVRMLKALDKPVAVYFEDIAINTLTQTGELLMVVMAAIAQGESEAKSESVKWGFQKRFEKGLPKLADLYGYTRDKRLLEIYEPEANVVRLIYQMFYDDKTIPEICYILNQQGIPSPRGGQWTYSTVKTILTNEKYSGDVLMQKTVTVDIFSHRSIRNDGRANQFFIQGYHEAIIPRELWLEVQQILKGENVVPVPSVDEVRILKNRISFNLATASEIGYPPFVRLFISRDKTQIALQPCAKETPNAMKFFTSDSTKDGKPKKRMIPVGNRALTALVKAGIGVEMNVPLKAPGVRFADEGVIIFDLKQATDMNQPNACTETGLCLIPTPAYPFVEMPSGYFAS